MVGFDGVAFVYVAVNRWLASRTDRFVCDSAGGHFDCANLIREAAIAGISRIVGIGSSAWLEWFGADSERL